MKWNHLPVYGGIYDQHPKMLDDFLVIDSIRISAENERARRQQAQSKRK